MKARYLMVGVLALVTASLWAVVLLGSPSGRGGGPHLPALNGTAPPTTKPEPAGSPPVSQPAPRPSPGIQAAQQPMMVACRPSSGGSASTTTSGSGGQSLLPSLAQLPVAVPLPVPTPHVP